MSKFLKAMEFVRSAEGGYVVDNGGPTNYGVTQTTYDSYRQRINLPLQSVKKITPREVEDLYRTLYWEPSHSEELGPCLSIAHFDWSVNHGVRGAMKTLQKAVDCYPDGVWGPRTKGHVKSVSDLEATTRYMALRDQWYDENHLRVSPTSINGWRNRVHRLWAFLLQEVNTA